MKNSKVMIALSGLMLVALSGCYGNLGDSQSAVGTLYQSIMKRDYNMYKQVIAGNFAEVAGTEAQMNELANHLNGKEFKGVSEKLVATEYHWFYENFPIQKTYLVDTAYNNGSGVFQPAATLEVVCNIKYYHLSREWEHRGEPNSARKTVVCKVTDVVDHGVGIFK